MAAGHRSPGLNQPGCQAVPAVGALRSRYRCAVMGRSDASLIGRQACMRNLTRTGSGRVLLAVGSSLLFAAGGVSGTAIAAAGTAQPQASQAAAVSRSATVVKEATRHHFGKILVIVKGRALYYLPSGSCTGQCLSVWPRLAMPAGKTIPKGAPCLGTKPFGTHHRLQVTYRKHRLYTFTGDSGTSVNGNGVAGFVVARVARSCR